MPKASPLNKACQPTRILLIEDDKRLSLLLTKYLKKHDLEVSQAYDGRSGHRQALQFRHDIILLDLMLPGLGGLEICQKIRAHSDVPIIMLTARDEEADCVMGLELGADDYVKKPFSSRELLARIHTVLRRSGNKRRLDHRTMEIGTLSIEPGSLRASIAGRPLDLTAYEFAILRVFAERPGMVLSREQILDLSKGSGNEPFDRSIDVHISKLRKKLGDPPKKPRIIKTIRGAGYMFAGKHTF